MPTRPAGDGELSETIELEPTPETQETTNTRTTPQVPPAPPPARQPCLEFDILPEDAAKLLRAPALAALRAGAIRSAAVNIVWHDTATATLARQGLSLGRQRGLWRVEALDPGGDASWLPAAPPLLLGQADSVENLAQTVPGWIDPGNLVPVAAFAGREKTVELVTVLGPARLQILDGVLRGVADEIPACRMTLSGAPADIAALVAGLAEHFAVSVPRASLAARAMAVAGFRALAPRRTGTPLVPHGTTVDQAMTQVIAHLADVILSWSARSPSAETPEVVHQMRVAVRRMRTALSVFSRAAGGDIGGGLSAELKAVASRLGVARDWDVFLSGAGAQVLCAFPGDQRVAHLLAAAARRQHAAYADLRDMLASAAWRSLELRLALLPMLRPWASGDEEQLSRLAAPAKNYAAAMLDRRLRHLAAPGEDIAMLSAEALHEVRKQAKRLRYASEFVAQLFSEKAVRKFLARLEDLQEALGAVNDSCVAASLMQLLGTGGGRAFAAGVVQGFVAAKSGHAAEEAAKAWRRFCRQEMFWD